MIECYKTVKPVQDENRSSMQWLDRPSRLPSDQMWGRDGPVNKSKFILGAKSYSDCSAPCLIIFSIERLRGQYHTRMVGMVEV
jgi:hypothetical protein